MRTRRQNGKGDASAAIVLAVLGVILALSASTGDASGHFIPALVGVCFGVGIIAGVIYALISIVKKSAGAGKKLNLRPSRREKDVEDLPMSSTIRSSDGAVYNENSAEELFRHDKEKRLDQLDVFLKNGIIDKKEYAILKDRYEKQSYERN